MQKTEFEDGNILAKNSLMAQADILTEKTNKTGLKWHKEFSAKKNFYPNVSLSQGPVSSMK